MVAAHWVRADQLKQRAPVVAQMIDQVWEDALVDEDIGFLSTVEHIRGLPGIRVLTDNEARELIIEKITEVISQVRNEQDAMINADPKFSDPNYLGALRHLYKYYPDENWINLSVRLKMLISSWLNFQEFVKQRVM